MWMYGLGGFVIGFLAGMAANLYLLQGTPRDELRTNKKLQKRFGALNWGMAFLGMVIALVIARSRL